MGGTNRHFIVPRGYLTGEEAAINWIAEEFQSMNKDQVKLDEVYANLMELMASGLVEVRSKRKRSQEWFSKQLAELKRSVHKAESAWLRSGSREDKNEKRKMYLEKRRFYAKAVRRAKREYEQSMSKLMWRNLPSFISGRNCVCNGTMSFPSEER